MGIVEIQVTDNMTNRFVPDEDYLEQSDRTKYEHDCRENLIQRLNMVERTEKFRTRMCELSSRWTDSLNGLGTVAHVGTIGPEHITRVAIIDIEKLKWVKDYSGSVSIGLDIHHGNSTRQRNLTRWIFGESVSPHEVFAKLIPKGVAKRLLSNRVGIKVFTNTQDLLEAA